MSEARDDDVSDQQMKTSFAPSWSARFPGVRRGGHDDAPHHLRFTSSMSSTSILSFLSELFQNARTRLR